MGSDTIVGLDWQGEGRRNPRVYTRCSTEMRGAVRYPVSHGANTSATHGGTRVDNIVFSAQNSSRF